MNFFEGLVCALLILLMNFLGVLALGMFYGAAGL